MIIPYLKGFFGFVRAPVTWILILLNFFLFAWTYRENESAHIGMMRFYNDEQFVGVQGYLFAQFIKRYPFLYNDFLVKMSDLVRAGESDQKFVLGALALRDIPFMKHGAQMKYAGDQVEIRMWKKHFDELDTVRKNDPSLEYGLSRANGFNFRSWITYQFYHGGWSHLIGNLFFLLIFGGAIEAELGGLTVLIAYLVAGVFSAAVFVSLSSVSSIPLVGASGSISGLMGLYIGLNWQRPMKYYYFILPVKGYSGFLFLPMWTGLLMWVSADLSGLIASYDDMGGVAHAAHLGGMLLGVLLGFFVLLGGETSSERVLSNTTRL